MAWSRRLLDAVRLPRRPRTGARPALRLHRRRSDDIRSDRREGRLRRPRSAVHLHGPTPLTAEISAGELMVAQAAREIRDGEQVFVGMRLPLIAFVVAKRTHAPNAIGLFELGLVRDEPAPELLYTMGDIPNVTGALWSGPMLAVMGMLQRGEVQAGFIGGAEIDRHGNLNTTAIGKDRRRPTVALPGSGGGADIASLAHRLIVIMPHDKRRLREKVDL